MTLDELYKEMYALAKEHGITDAEIEGMLLADEDDGIGAEESAKGIIEMIKSGGYEQMKEILSGIDSKKFYDDLKTVVDKVCPYGKRSKNLPS